MKYSKIFLAILPMIISACSDNSDTPGLSLSFPDTTTLDAKCRELSIPVEGTDWTATSDADWLRIVNPAGSASDICLVYVEQNDGDAVRQATLCFSDGHGHDRSVELLQEPVAENGWGAIVDLPQSFALGWGYDARTDVADMEGVRGQVFNEKDIKYFYETDEPAQVYNATGTSTTLISEESAESMSRKISTEIYGEVDLKVASAKIEAEFAEQITENKSRLYVWYRDCRQVKVCNLAIDILDEDIAPLCFTSDFKKSISNLVNSKITPAEFVNIYGTHVVKRTYLGGKLDYYFTVSKDVKEKVETITLTVSVKLLGMKKSASSVSQEKWEEIKKDFSGNFRVSGGGAAGNHLAAVFEEYCNQGDPIPDKESNAIDNWQAVFYDYRTVQPEDLALIDCYLVPISDIVELRSRSAADKLKKYIYNEYLK